MTGFARNAVLGVADTLIGAVKSGDIKHFLLVGGCDGARPGRNYYTDFVRQTPQDTVVLTQACGKYRFNDLNIGEIGGLPRLIDMGVEPFLLSSTINICGAQRLVRKVCKHCKKAIAATESEVQKLKQVLEAIQGFSFDSLLQKNGGKISLYVG